MVLKCFVNDSEMLLNNFEKLSNDFEMFFNDFFNDLNTSLNNYGSLKQTTKGGRRPSAAAPLCRCLSQNSSNGCLNH